MSDYDIDSMGGLGGPAEALRARELRLQAANLRSQGVEPAALALEQQADVLDPPARPGMFGGLVSYVKANPGRTAIGVLLAWFAYKKFGKR